MRQLSDVEKTKLVLLSKSKNLVDAVCAKKWQEFTELERSWQQQINEAILLHGEALEPIRKQLLSDTETIQEHLRQAQQELSKELKSTTQSAQATKQYLK